jgi:hypothetical protein
MDGKRTVGLSHASFHLRGTGLVLPFLLLTIGWWGGSGPAIGSAKVTATSRILPTGDALELTYQSDGDTWRDLLPIHHAGPVRYLRAGVGMAERAAEYPPFPIKLVLTAGGKPYVARVGVEVVSHDGAIKLSIPPDHVTGPWLFLDLPAGTYDLTGTRGEDRPQLRRVTVQPGLSQTLYLRFSGD